MNKKAIDVAQVVGTIEATEVSTTKNQGEKAQTTYSTLRLAADVGGETIFKDGVKVDRRVNTFVEPGSRGAFFFWKKRKFVWLYAYKTPDGTLVHDVDGVEKTATRCFLGAIFLLGVPLYWFLITNGYRGGVLSGGVSEGVRIGILILSPPMVLTGLLCFWGARAATRNLKMLREFVLTNL